MRSTTRTACAVDVRSVMPQCYTTTQNSPWPTRTACAMDALLQWLSKRIRHDYIQNGTVNAVSAAQLAQWMHSESCRINKSADATGAAVFHFLCFIIFFRARLARWLRSLAFVDLIIIYKIKCTIPFKACIVNGPAFVQL